MAVSLTQHLPFKIISVVLALVLYLFVMQDKEVERDLTLSIVVDSEPEDYVLLTQLPEVEVTVAGRSRNLARLERSRLEEVSLSFSRPADLYRLTESDFDLPPGLEIIDIDPETIDLHFVPKATDWVPVVVSVSGNPPAGYKFTTTVSPGEVLIEGPAAVVQDLQEIRTQEIDVRTLREDAVRRVSLQRLDSELRYDREQQVMVAFDIELDWGNVEISEVPISVSGPEGRFSLDRQTLTLLLRGPQIVINQLDRSRIRATIDGTPYLNSPAGTYDVSPTVLNLPADVTVESIDYGTLRLTVSAPPTIEFRPIPLPTVFPLPLPVPG